LIKDRNRHTSDFHVAPSPIAEGLRQIIATLNFPAAVGEDLSNQRPLSVIGVFIAYWHEYQAAVAVHIREAVKLMLLSRAIWR
jgi:hypothetical protein